MAPSTFTTQLINQYGAPGNYRFSDVQTAGAATVIEASGFKLVSLLEPWCNTEASSILKHHPVAWWSELKVTVYPQAGAYGRMCTFYGGWSAHGSPRPKTMDDMLRLHGAFTRTWGGTGDPGVNPQVVQCVFNDTMTDTLKTPYNDTVRAVFYYCFTEVLLVDKAQSDDRFLLHFEGTFNVQGKY